MRNVSTKKSPKKIDIDSLQIKFWTQNQGPVQKHTLYNIIYKNVISSIPQINSVFKIFK